MVSRIICRPEEWHRLQACLLMLDANCTAQDYFKWEEEEDELGNREIAAVVNGHPLLAVRFYLDEGGRRSADVSRGTEPHSTIFWGHAVEMLKWKVVADHLLDEEMLSEYELLNLLVRLQTCSIEYTW